MVTRRSCLLCIFSLLGTIVAAQETNFRCFDIPQATADRSSVTITIGRINWVSHGLVSAVAEIALREFLGYTVRGADLSDSWSFGVDLASGLADTDLEQWTNPLGDAQYRDYISTSKQVHDLGTIGYFGRSAMWTFKSAVQQNRYAGYYKFYQNETVATAGGFVSFGESGDSLGDSYCEPDPDAPWCEESAIEGYWATPACRTSPDSCLLVLHSTTYYDRGYFEQVLRNNGIKAIFGYYGEDGFPERVRSFIGQSRYPLFYWWEPDPLLFELDAVRISFPDHSTGCDVKLGQPLLLEDAENGSISCDYGPKTLWKAVSNRLRVEAPEAFYLFTKLIVTADQMDSLLRASITQGSSDTAMLHIACDFIKDNMALFRTFAPTCITHPPSPVRDGDLVFDPDSLQCESATVFYTTDKTHCFATGLRPGIADRSDQTIRLARRTWTTHDIVSVAAEVILRDYLGFNVELVYNNRTNQILAPMEILEGHYDADMETWLPNYWELNPELYSPYLDALLTGEVEVVGSTGFAGRSGIFIRREALAVNPFLDFHRPYENASEVQALGIVSHADTRLQELAGDEFPVCDVGSLSWCGAGALEGFWAPPACEAQPDHCIEIVHNSPYRDQGLVEQLVGNLGLEAVVAYYGDAGAVSLLMSQVGTGKASPFYWWEPDALLTYLDAVRISFPDFYLGCDDGNTHAPDGNVACDFPGTELKKLALASLKTTVPEAYYALVHLEVFKEQVNNILLAHQSKSLADAICEWMAANPTQMDVWAPSCLTSPIPPEEVRAGDLVFDPAELQCKPIVCEANEVLRYVAASRTFYCDPCVDGSVPNEPQTLCVSCPAGQEVNGSGGQCRDCDPGTFKTAEATICESCSDGRYMPQSGQSACLFCNATSYQDLRGAVDCKLCEDVVVGAVTPILGATSSSFCSCRQGTYLPLESTRCEMCPEGMECPEGADAENFPSSGQDGAGSPYPQVREGYMTIPGEPFRVYECIDKEHCPGGPPGKCAHLRDSRSIACGRCEDDAYEKDSGCTKCGSLDVLPLIVTAALGLTAAVVVGLVANRNLLMKSSAVLMAVMMAGIAMTTLQTLTVFRQISVDWFEPFQSLFQMLKVVSFDLEVLRMGCVMGNSEVRQYTFRQLVAPVSILILLVTLLFKKHYKPQMVIFNEFVNTVGTLFNIFFISIIVSCVSPLVCYPHPGNSGRSVVGNPATLCNFEDDHAYVVTTGCIAWLCVPVPFLALVAFGILRYPRFVQSSLDSQWFLASFRFLFMRFHPSAYYFGALTVTRGVCCCLVPVVLDQPGVQVVVLAMIIGIYVLVQQNLQPWRAKLANIVDGLLGFLLLLILLCLAVLTDLPGTKAVPAVAVIGFVGTLIAPAAITVYIFFKKSFRDSYHIFICHHKADAAAQSRLLKMLLTAMTGKRIFIDSDDLVELDKLFDIVKTQVKLLLVYLTRDTLTRPWCVGEITTNWACKGKTATVKTPSFVQPSDDEAKELHLLVDTASCNLQEQGITQEFMALALAKVVVAPAIVMNSEENGSWRFLTVAERITQNGFGEGASSPRARSGKLSVSLGALVLTADAGDDEAVAASGIMAKKIEMLVHSYVEGGVTNLLDGPETSSLVEAQYVESSRACIVLLSRGSLDRMSQLAIIVRGMASPSTVMIPATLWDFKFPTPHFYQNTLPDMWLETVGNTLEEAQAGIRAFFNLIAVAFSTMANDTILDTQSTQVAQRVPRNFDKATKASLLKGSSKSLVNSSAGAHTSASQEKRAFSSASSAASLGTPDRRMSQNCPLDERLLPARLWDTYVCVGSDGDETIISSL